MRKNQMENTVDLTITLPLSQDKRKAIEMYNDAFLSELQADLQRAAEKLLNQTYSRTVPKPIRDYLKRCEEREARFEQNEG